MAFQKIKQLWDYYDTIQRGEGEIDHSWFFHAGKILSWVCCCPEEGCISHIKTLEYLFGLPSQVLLHVVRFWRVGKNLPVFQTDKHWPDTTDHFTLEPCRYPPLPGFWHVISIRSRRVFGHDCRRCNCVFRFHAMHRTKVIQSVDRKGLEVNPTGSPRQQKRRQETRSLCKTEGKLMAACITRGFSNPFCSGTLFYDSIAI